MDRDILTIDEVAQMLSVSLRTVQRYIKANKLKAHKAGSKWVIRQIDLKEFLGQPVVVKQLDDTWTQQVIDYLQQSTPPAPGVYRTCTIIDTTFTSAQQAQRVSGQLLNIVNNIQPNQVQARFHYTYNPDTSLARFILWGDTTYIAACINVLNKEKK